MTNTSNVTNTHNGHSFVDLGLPSGLLWATCNVGATSPEQAGLYFAWGETTGFSAEQVKTGVRKFSYNEYYRYFTGSAAYISTDLNPEQDAAHVHMGGKWRIYTKNDFQELKNCCISTWTDNYNNTGVAGRLFTSKVNGNSIFLPAAGLCGDSSVCNVGSGGYYWTASRNSGSYARSLFFINDGFNLFNFEREYGMPVRGVCER